MRDLVIIILILVFFIASLRSAYAACLTYWWFSVFRPHDYAYADISSLRIPLLATLLFFMISFLRGYRPKINDPIAVLMVLFYVLGTFASLVYGCDSQYKVIEPIEYLAILFVALFLTIDIVKTKQQLFGLVCVVTLSLAFYSSKAGIAAMIAGGAINYGASNLGGMFTGSNRYAMGTAILIFFMIFIYRQTAMIQGISWIPRLLRDNTKLLKIIMGVVILGSVFNVISLYSRGSALAMFLGFLVLYLLHGKKLKALFLLIPMVTILVAVVPIPDEYDARIKSAFADKEELDASASSRPYFWNIAVDIVNDHPAGIGLNCYRYYYNIYGQENEQRGWSRDVHSSHFNALVDAGYLGVLIWFVLFAVSIGRLFKIKRLIEKNKNDLADGNFYQQLCDSIITAQVVFMIGGSFYTLTYMDLIWWMWALTIILTKMCDIAMRNHKQQAS